MARDQGTSASATPAADEATPRVEETVLGGLVGYALRRAQLANFRHLNAAVGEYRIRPAQFSVMVMAETYPGVTQSELSQELNVDPPRMVNLLHNLEERGLAVRVRCKSDRRSHGIFLTKRGETILQELKQLIRDAEEKHMAQLSPEERETLLSLLRRLF